MAIDSTDVAILTARSASARAGAVRAGFVPRETVNAAGTAYSGPFYMYSRQYPSATTWTPVVEP
jgi:hypothetical protein